MNAISSSSKQLFPFTCVPRSSSWRPPFLFLLVYSLCMCYSTIALQQYFAHSPPLLLPFLPSFWNLVDFILHQKLTINSQYKLLCNLASSSLNSPICNLVSTLLLNNYDFASEVPSDVMVDNADIRVLKRDLCKLNGAPFCVIGLALK